jgi:hypothetical protein
VDSSHFVGEPDSKAAMVNIAHYLHKVKHTASLLNAINLDKKKDDWGLF